MARHSPYITPELRCSSPFYSSSQHLSSVETCSVPAAGAPQTSSYCNGMRPELSSQPGDATLLTPSVEFSSATMNNQLRISYLSDSSSSDGSNSDCSESPANSPYSNFSVEEASLVVDPYNTRCCQEGYYSEPTSSCLNSGGVASAQAVPRPSPQPALVAAANSSDYPYATAPSPMLPCSMPYSSQDYSLSNFSSTRFMPSTVGGTCSAALSYFSGTFPSLSNHFSSLNMHKVMWR